MCFVYSPHLLFFRPQRLAALFLALMPVVFAPSLANAGKVVSEPLTLQRAGEIALQHDPMVQMRQARSQALLEGSVADGELADPKLRLGLYNLPLDSLSITENPTTQLRLGVQQAFPRGDTLKLKRRRSEARAQAELARAEDVRRELLSKTRVAWLGVWYEHQVQAIIGETRVLFAQLVDITESQYASGRVTQQDVLRAQLELLRLDDRETQSHNREEAQRASLSKWLGDAAQRPLSDAFPQLPTLPDRETLMADLVRHPRIVEASARLYAANQGTGISREQYKPGWNLGVEYRKRFGNDPGGGDRADMAALMLTVDLPLFPEKRQDRRLAASLKQAEAATAGREDRIRKLKALLLREYANWQRAGERYGLYQHSLIANAAENSEAALSAYQNGVSEFTTLMRARTTELNIRLQALRARVDQAKAVARLLYLVAEPVTALLAVSGKGEEP